MIRVRHKKTGQERDLGESAFPYYAGIYERVDQPSAAAPAAAGGGQPAPAQQPAPGKGSRATTNENKEE